MKRALGVSTSERILFVHHVARRIKRSPRTVRRLIQQGRLSAQRQGRRCWRISVSEVDRFVSVGWSPCSN